MSVSYIMLEEKAPKRYRYAFFSAAIMLLFINIGVLLTPFLGPLLLPLYNPESFDPILVSSILLPVITLFGSGTIAPLFAYWKPFERLWERRLKRQNSVQFRPNHYPKRSDVFRYPVLQKDRESYYNFFVSTISFCLLLFSSLILYWVPLIFSVANILRTD